MKRPVIPKELHGAPRISVLKHLKFSDEQPMNFGLEDVLRVRYGQGVMGAGTGDRMHAAQCFLKTLLLSSQLNR